MPRLPTVQVRHPDYPDRPMIINEANFDPAVHVLWGEEAPSAEPEAGAGPDGEGEADNRPPVFADMEYGDLLALVAERGLEPESRRKADLVAALEAAGA